MTSDEMQAVLDLVAADLLATTGLVGDVVVVEDAEWGPSLLGPGDTGILADSPVGVAAAARDGLVEQVWGAWPLCPRDGRVLDPEQHDDGLWWVCVTGHRVAAVGSLATAGDGPGTRSRRRRKPAQDGNQG